MITYLHSSANAGLVQLNATHGTAIFLREFCLLVARHLKERTRRRKERAPTTRRTDRRVVSVRTKWILISIQFKSNYSHHSSQELWLGMKWWKTQTDRWSEKRMDGWMDGGWMYHPCHWDKLSRGTHRSYVHRSAAERNCKQTWLCVTQRNNHNRPSPFSSSHKNFEGLSVCNVVNGYNVIAVSNLWSQNSIIFEMKKLSTHNNLQPNIAGRVEERTAMLSIWPNAGAILSSETILPATIVRCMKSYGQIPSRICAT